jgi:hypothetical protein
MMLRPPNRHGHQRRSTRERGLWKNQWSSHGSSANFFDWRRHRRTDWLPN